MKPNMILAAALAAAPFAALAPHAAQAQTYQYSSAPAIQGFDVDEVRRLRPGAELAFKLWGTPGGIATLHIAGATRNLTMVETEPGQYEGTYTLGTHDRVTPRSPVSANLRVGNTVATSVLSESLVRGVGLHRDNNPRAAAVAAAQGPRIETFNVEQVEDLAPGNDIVFAVRGTPGARVAMSIGGTHGTFFLPEVSPGEYRGRYTIRRADRIDANSNVTATLRMGDRETTAALGRPLLAGREVAAQRSQVARYCSNCATVESVNVVNVAGDAGYLGMIGGALAGGVVGGQVGSGTGRTAAEVAGAAAGAYAGRELERRRNQRQVYEVLVRYPNGGSQTITYENDPGFRAGDRVKVEAGTLVRDQQ
ncbi:MAG: glycine zipper 2TM domain-containing protein [Telluria sp.]